MKKIKLNKVWLALIPIIIIIILVVVFIASKFQSNQVKDSAELAVKDYFAALDKGDYAKLKQITCGEQKKYYMSISADDFNKLYKQQKKAGDIYKLQEIESSAVDGDKALVKIRVNKLNSPEKIIATGINLSKQDNQWQICQLK